MATPAATVHEPARNLPVAGTAEVFVAGGGPAGFAAALTAARAGARVQLVETQGCLGGVWTAGLVTWIIDAENKTGLMRELLDDLDRRNARNHKAFDPEAMKLLLEEKALHAGINILLHTRVCAAAVDDRRLTAALTENKSGRAAWQAKVFIDATGDGDLAAAAGCSFDLGRPQDGRAQPLSMLCLLTGLDEEQLRRQGLLQNRANPTPDHKQALRQAFQAAGVEPSYTLPTLLPIRPGLLALMANHEYGPAATDAQAISQATFHARAELHHLLDAMVRNDPAWKNARLLATPEQIGIREGRRIHGRYTVTAEDLRNGSRHPQAVCRATFGIDVHGVDPNHHRGVEPANHTPTQAYDIPLPALLAQDRNNLLLAGRCISGDFLAHSSYRVTGNAVPLGQAAGATAALAARHRCPPHQVPFQDIAPLIDRPPDD